MLEELDVSIRRGHTNKVKKILHALVAQGDAQHAAHLRPLLTSEVPDGIMLRNLARAFFRLNRTSLSDCSTLFLLQDIANINVQDALLEVVGYDRMVPPVEMQKRIILQFFHFGDFLDHRHTTDPRYGLAAACAQWEESIVHRFLLHCLRVDDAGLRYVAENSLNRKYVKLRSHC
ncbi:hypothetical protein [Hymenobacter sp. BT190]|uniref:hypothetical protein n=1 Tax=Hymenobacter sp. BT190 TaxID=2763505 RepID=UPI0016516BDF|nr:hypothetical protein [Hymenobacter sp. BT190]MBC6697721.1 hypothetical protein [Hymenobacter sp. BT190]